MSERQEKTYIMGNDFIEVPIKVNPKQGKEAIFTHTLKRPTFEQEETRERSMPIITEEAGKVEGSVATSQRVDDEDANIKFYNKLAVKVKGYKIEGSTEEVEVGKVISTPDGEKSILDLIPSSHKTTAILGMWVSSFEVNFGGDEEEEFSFSLGAAREWKVDQKIGGQHQREDGSIAPPDWTVTYVLSEPSEADRKNYRAKAMASSSYMKNGGIRVERASVNLKVLRDLFDKLIQSVEGASVNIDGTPVPLDVRNKAHLELIPATFKKTVVIRLFNALEADLGN